MHDLMLALAMSLGAASPSSSIATWPPAAATCAPDARSNHFACPQADPALVEMFARAHAHDVAGVERASARIATGGSADDKIDPLYAKLARAFALALADPKMYESPFVRACVGAGFSGYHFLDQINEAGLAPSPFEIITRHAAAGDGLAYAAIVGATAPLTEFHAPFDPPYDSWTIAHSGAKVFAAIGAAGPEPVAAYLCTEQDEVRDPGSARRTVAKLKATTPKGRALLAKLKALIANCNAYDANF